MKKNLFFLITILFIVFILSNSCFAYKKEKYPDKVENRFIVTPTRYDLKLKPGQEIVEKVTVVNRLGEREEFFVEIEGFTNSENSEELNSSVGWIKPEVQKFYLDQGERIEFDLYINVPESLSPAGYYANLIVSNQRNSQEDSRGQKINLVNRISIPLLSTIPGKFDLSGELVGFLSDKFFYFKGPVLLEANFLNKGNIHLYPKGEIKVYNFLNKKIFEKSFDSEAILPNNQKKWKLSLDNKIFIGRYRAIFSVNYGDDSKQLFKEKVFWAFPLHLLLLIILTIYLIHSIIKRIEERYEIVKKMKKISKNKIKFVFYVILSLFLANSSQAKMESESFKINADVIGIGGDLGDSENYTLTDTVGEAVIGVSDSENYGAQQGFWQMISTGISLTIDSNTVSLGNVIPTNSGDGQSVLSVITDSWGGYNLYISQNHPLLHNDSFTEIEDISCEISSPCLWSGYGFGFTVKAGTNLDNKWGTSPDYKYAKTPLSATLFHEKEGYKSGADETTVGYKVVPRSTQKSGFYSNIITYTAMAKL